MLREICARAASPLGAGPLRLVAYTVPRRSLQRAPSRSLSIDVQRKSSPPYGSVNARTTFFRRYAAPTSVGTTGPGPARRKTVTVLNDDGLVPWGQLSPAEKAARTVQQSFNFTLIIGGAVLTVAIFTYMYTDVFSPQSGTNHFNRAVDRIKADPNVTKLLGDSKEIRAFGEASWNKWRRNRPLAFRTETDKFGTERLYMHFNLAGPKRSGVAQLYMLRRQGEKQFNYGYLAVDIPGQSRVYVERADSDSKSKPTGGRFLGIKWS